MSYCAQESLDPVVLRSVFLLATRQLYADAENYGDLREPLGRLVYRPELADCTLPVELDFEYNPAELSPRHAVYVGLGDCKFGTAVLDHRADVSEDRAKITYMQNAETTLRLRYLAPTAAAALHLATVGAAYYMAMSRVFLDRLGLNRFDLQVLSAPQLVDKAPVRLFEVSLGANLAFNFNIVSTLEGQRLKTYQLSTLPLTP